LKSAFLNRKTIIILFHVLLFAFIANVIYTHTGKINAVKMPPKSLSQWYKPENKRQVWLHNMFKLRREMQAVEFYAAQQDSIRLSKWATRLSEHYLKIAEMVPEWQNELDTQTLATLQDTVKQNNFDQVPHELKKLSVSCDSCHKDYQASTAALYRAPDFKDIQINGSNSYTEHMETLSKQINQIKIASEDGMKSLALSSLSELEKGIHTLGKTCSNCHKDSSEVYVTEEISSTMRQLEQNLKTGTFKDQGKDLGTLAVLACARCHGTHRIAFNVRKQLSEEMNWKSLLKH
tara:strand:+ start:9722 stop:10594 length:873 start_codon:yes stop_codon:yes gene_type:complete